MFNKFSIQISRNYSVRLFLIHTKYRLRDAADYIKELRSRTQSIEMPEKFRGTVVEKWADYWKNLCIDYMDVYKDTVKSCRENPQRFGMFISLAGLAAGLASTNPDDVSYRDNIIKHSNALSLIGPSIQNPDSVKFLRNIEVFYNQDRVRWFSFGLFSIIYVDDYNSSAAVCKAQCSYIEPRYVDFLDRVIDFGVFGKWWILDKHMIDYDVNPLEWSKSKNS